MSPTLFLFPYILQTGAPLQCSTVSHHENLQRPEKDAIQTPSIPKRIWLNYSLQSLTIQSYFLNCVTICNTATKILGKFIIKFQSSQNLLMSHYLLLPLNYSSCLKCKPKMGHQVLSGKSRNYIHCKVPYILPKCFIFLHFPAPHWCPQTILNQKAFITQIFSYLSNPSHKAPALLCLAVDDTHCRLFSRTHSDSTIFFCHFCTGAQYASQYFWYGSQVIWLWASRIPKCSKAFTIWNFELNFNSNPPVLQCSWNLFLQVSCSIWIL